MEGKTPPRVAFDSFTDDNAICITDPIERCQYTIRSERSVTPAEVDPDVLPFPVDAAVSVIVETLTFDQLAHAFVRDASGEMVAEVSPGTEQTMDVGTYDVEINGPMKLYLHAAGPLTVTAGVDRLTFDFGEETDVRIGVRSFHHRPAATVTTTDDPDDLCRAISALGSALKTTSPERSFPTLRGHPPLISRGETLAIPDDLSPPSTGVRLEVPADHRSVLVVAPLAYYLGATVVPATSPRLVTEAGFEYSLDGAGGFEETVERTLKQVFFLDCCTRTEGHYRVALRERAAVESDVDLDFAALYDRSLAAQLAAYLSIPYAAIEAQIPRWSLTAHLPADPESAEAIPFVVDELAVIRSADATRVPPEDVRSAIYSGYSDEPQRLSADESPRPAADEPTRSAGDDGAIPALVDIGDTGSVEEAWFGEKTPIRGSKSTITAFRNALERTPKEGPIEVVVVHNGEGIVEARDVVDDVYGSREELEFCVTLHHDLSTRELREVLDTPADFLHYIGHIDDDGIHCHDGHVDARMIDAVGVDAFLLNGCRSYDQGLALVDAGSIGGVVTVADVVDSGAITVGKAMARLLNLGFSLRAALSVARRTSVVGGHYLVVGNGQVAIAQRKFGSPLVCRIESAGEQFLLTIEAYLPAEGGMGSMLYPAFESNDTYFLYPSTVGPFELPRAELRRYLKWHDYPVELDGEWYWRGNQDRLEERLS